MSAEVCRVVDQSYFLEIIQNSEFNVVEAMTTWKTMAATQLEEMGTKDSVPFSNFDSEIFVGFRLDLDLPFVNNLCSILADVAKTVSDYYQSSPPDLNTVVGPIISTVGQLRHLYLFRGSLVLLLSL